MKIVISGCNGFIGQHLKNTLEEQGNEVFPLDRQLLVNYDTLKIYLEDLQPDMIFHLAAYGNHSTQKDPDMTLSANVFSTYIFLKASLDIPYKAFINFGSSSEYGIKHTAMKESAILEPETLYGATKAAGTHLSSVFAKQFNKPIVTVRPFSVYGEGEADFRFIPTVINALKNNSPLTLTEGNHDWIYVADFIDGMIRVANNADKLQGQVVNIGTGRQTSNSAIVQELEYITKRKADIILKTGSSSADSPVWKADNSKLKRLGWRQKTTLADGLRYTYEYSKNLP